MFVRFYKIIHILLCFITVVSFSVQYHFSIACTVVDLNIRMRTYDLAPCMRVSICMLSGGPTKSRPTTPLIPASSPKSPILVNKQSHVGSLPRRSVGFGGVTDKNNNTLPKGRRSLSACEQLGVSHQFSPKRTPDFENGESRGILLQQFYPGFGLLVFSFLWCLGYIYTAVGIVV